MVGMGLVVPGANSPEEFWRSPDGRSRSVPQCSAGSLGLPVILTRRTRLAEDKSYQSRSVFITAFDPLKSSARSQARTGRLRVHYVVAAPLAGPGLEGRQAKPDDRFSFRGWVTPPMEASTSRRPLCSRGALHRLTAGIANTSAAEPRKRQLLGGSSRSSRSATGVAPTPARYLPHRVGRNAMTGVLPGHTELMMVDTACSSSLYAVDIGREGLADRRARHRRVRGCLRTGARAAPSCLRSYTDFQRAAKCGRSTEGVTVCFSRTARA